MNHDPVTLSHHRIRVNFIDEKLLSSAFVHDEMTTMTKSLSHVFALTGHRAAHDVHSVSSRLVQSAVRHPVRDGCSQINVFPGLSDVPTALPAAH